MKKLFCLLLLTSNLLLAQSNIALLHIEKSIFDSSASSLSAFTEVSFELAGGMVIVQATVDGQTGNFILDTGAPGIVLNSQNSEAQPSSVAASIGGQMKAGIIELKNFEWGIIHQDNLEGFMLDVSHLEVACGREIMGLIGFSVLKNYELFFDYRNKVLKVFKSNMTEPVGNLRRVKSIPFTLLGHVPVISAKVGGKRVYLGLDSGAEINLLDQKLFDKLDSSMLKHIEQEYLTGLDNQRQQVTAADISQTFLKNHTLPSMRFVFSDLKLLREQFGTPLDGLLGFPFFKNQVISIDYKRKKIHIWE